MLQHADQQHFALPTVVKWCCNMLISNILHCWQLLSDVATCWSATFCTSDSGKVMLQPANQQHFALLTVVKWWCNMVISNILHCWSCKVMLQHGNQQHFKLGSCKVMLQPANQQHFTLLTVLKWVYNMWIRNILICCTVDSSSSVVLVNGIPCRSSVVLVNGIQ